MSEQENTPLEGVGETENLGEALAKNMQNYEERRDEPELTEPVMKKIEEEIEEIESSIDEKSYPLGEVPQIHLFDPTQDLPINSEKIQARYFEQLLSEVDLLTKDELKAIQKLQKSINGWEKTIDQNRGLIEENKALMKQNKVDIQYDEKNRDYWFRRAEEVMMDYQIASNSGNKERWAWFIKKHGLKNPDGTMISESSHCVDELCNGGADNLAAKYKVAGNKYFQDKIAKEEQNCRLAAEIARAKKSNEVLQQYIHATYQERIEPIQDGVLLLKELGAKLRALDTQGDAKWGELRKWAEEFIDEFLLENPNTPEDVVVDFRRIASIPLPSENS